MCPCLRQAMRRLLRSPGCAPTAACTESQPTSHRHSEWVAWQSYWAKQNARQHDRTIGFLKNLSEWNWSASDADFCDEGGKAIINKVTQMITTRLGF